MSVFNSLGLVRSAVVGRQTQFMNDDEFTTEGLEKRNAQKLQTHAKIETLAVVVGAVGAFVGLEKIFKKGVG